MRAGVESAGVAVKPLRPYRRNAEYDFPHGTGISFPGFLFLFGQACLSK